MTGNQIAKILANDIVDRRGRGFCYGQFLLHVIGAPEIPKRWSPEWRKIVEQGAAYIGVNGNIESRHPEQLLADDAGSILIEKVARHCRDEIIVQIAALHPGR